MCSGVLQSHWDRGCHNLHRHPVGQFAPFWLIWDFWDLSTVTLPLPRGLGTSSKAQHSAVPSEGLFLEPHSPQQCH